MNIRAPSFCITLEMDPPVGQKSIFKSHSKKYKAVFCLIAHPYPEITALSTAIVVLLTAFSSYFSPCKAEISVLDLF